MDEDKLTLVSVFSSTNFAVFQLAKSLLNEHEIKFWSNGEYMPPILIGSPYTFEIKVYKKNEQAAKKILRELKPTSDQYIPSNEPDKKIQSFIKHWGLVILLMFIIILITIFFLLK